MYRLALLAILMFAGLLLARVAPADAAGGCSVQSAPAITSGQTQQSDPTACPDHRQYWAMDLAEGDTLTVDATPASGFIMDLGVYGPNPGSIGRALCSQQGNSFPYRLACLIPADGRYVLVTDRGAGSFTPTRKTVPAQAGRVPGACDPTAAPPTPSGVTEYGNGELCQPAGTRQFWTLDANAGDTLIVDALPFGGGIFDLDVYGPNAPGPTNTPLCGQDADSFPYSFSCAIQHTGRYLLASNRTGQFTPLLEHPTHVTQPRVKGGGARIALRAVVNSDAPHPTGTCLLQQRIGARWVTEAHVRTTTGVCKGTVKPKGRGTVRLRIRFRGAKGWASSTSRVVKVARP